MKTPLLTFRAATVLFFLTGSFTVVNAQEVPATSITSFDQVYHNWYNLDAKEDKVEGVSVNRAYRELLGTKKSKKTIVVAVIDSGTDINHEDLQGKIWVNQREVAGNKLDDDNNGYVDDIHGWGFLGNANGENIQYENFEYVRLLRKLKPKYEYVKSVHELPADEQEVYKTYLLSKKYYQKELDKRIQEKENLEGFARTMQECATILGQHFGRSTFTLSDVKEIKASGARVIKARDWLLTKYSQGYTPESFQAAVDRNKVFLEQHLNLDYAPRTITGDDPEDINNTAYGNNNITGPRADHGTPVSGLIAGIRGNNKGIEGIAENVQIMVLRAVPEGDEYDKDIALAIRYAVDNGAHIINMSFGKDFSPQKAFVDEAVKYAEQHNVLLVHSAGNDGLNIDTEINFPTKQFIDKTRAKNWLEVGATSMKADKDFPGVFSNYGKQNVDLFAPGVAIVSLAPDNSYDMMDGTSFASPVVAGVAALVWSYYPELTAVELKDVLLQSSTKYEKLKVYAPDVTNAKKEKVNFSKLSGSGGVVNAFEALKLAEKLVSES